MLFPSTLVIFVGALFVAVLAAADWYVWGLNSAIAPRQPRNPVPLTGLEIIDLALGRLIAANQAVLPKAAFETAYTNGVVTSNPNDGFKRVA
jgi:hypothetical protein